jgi:hypothetical protein
MLVEASRSTGGWLSALELVSQPKPRRGDQQRPSGQPSGGEAGDETDPERAAKRRRRRRRGRRGAPLPVTASTTEPGAETGAPAAPTIDGQPQEGLQRRRRRRRRRGRGRGAGLGQQPGQPGDTAGTPPDEQSTVAPAAAGDIPEV